MTESTDSTSTSGARERAANLKQRLREDGKQRMESGKRAAADQIADIADAIDKAGAHLDESQPTLANFAASLADRVGGLATHLREDSIGDLYRQVRQMAVRHPGMFLLGSAAVGVVIARFMKASGEDLDVPYEEYDERVEFEAQAWSEADRQQNPSFYRGSASSDTYGAP
ncbi:hypothetical protein [Steroidobacter cummioxidans]|uniref:hypothetical protein n=1 Tax=Steroidobacter cummioxidans TaxID=1803913 RepID=UPI00129008DD|nr:hypothetical protein [Steroidobacter cummioxidans]